MFSNRKKTIIGFISLLVAPTIFAQTAENYTPLIGTGSYNNFKTNYSPEKLNTNSTSNIVTLRTRHSGLSQSRVKIFIPPGAKTFRTSIVTYAVNEPARAAARFSFPPVSLVTDVVPDFNGSTDTRKTLEKLQNGEELRFYSPEKSGVLMVATANSNSSYQSNIGGYIYINFFGIPGGSFMSFDTQVEVEKTCYQSWYQSISSNDGWNSTTGNPQDGVEYTCAGGSTTPTLTDIALSPSTWKIGTNSGSITVTPVGTNNPALPENCSSDSSLVTLSQPSDGQTAKFSVTGTVATETSVKITCGDKEETLTLQPADPNAAQILDKVPSADTAGNLVINFKLKRPDTELVATNKTNFWVAALLPKTSFPYMNDEEEWFFFTPTGWMQQNSPNPLSVAYQINQVPTAETSFRIPTGLPQAIAEYFNAELYFGYMGADGAFKNMGIIWKKN